MGRWSSEVACWCPARPHVPHFCDPGCAPESGVRGCCGTDPAGGHAGTCPRSAMNGGPGPGHSDGWIEVTALGDRERSFIPAAGGLSRPKTVTITSDDIASAGFSLSRALAAKYADGMAMPMAGSRSYESRPATLGELREAWVTYGGQDREDAWRARLASATPADLDEAPWGLWMTTEPHTAVQRHMFPHPLLAAPRPARPARRPAWLVLAGVLLLALDSVLSVTGAGGWMAAWAAVCCSLGLAAYCYATSRPRPGSVETPGHEENR